MDRETKNEFGKVRSEMSAEFAKVRTEMSTEFGKARVEMAAEFGKLHGRLDEMMRIFVTKKDLKNEFANFAAKVFATFVNKAEFDIFKEDLFENMATRQQIDDNMVRMDWAVREAKKARDEQDLFSYRFVELDDQVKVHERRIRKLEKAKISS